MVTLNFQGRFRAPILAGTKRQTLRRQRRHPVYPHQLLHLYTGLRTKRAALIGKTLCTSVTDVMLDLKYDILGIGVGTQVHQPKVVDEFARADGFDDWETMKAWFKAKYPEVGDQWIGIRICWGDLMVRADTDGRFKLQANGEGA